IASEPAGVADGVVAAEAGGISLPAHSAIALQHATAGGYALAIAVLGTVLAYVFYGARLVDPGEVRRQFPALHRFRVAKWWFDELYDVAFVRPVHIVGSWCAAIDRNVFDGILHFLARLAVIISHWDRLFDEHIIDGFVNRLADATYATGHVFSYLQTGRLRQYVMFIVVGVVGIALLAKMFL